MQKELLLFEGFSSISAREELMKTNVENYASTWLLVKHPIDI